jgi:2-dehydro-3-deoxygluconokinase
MTGSIVAIGECMIELVRADDNHWKLGWGGDTLNTALYLARLGDDVAYLTALGADPFSADMRQEWAAEGIDTSLVLTDETRLPGLYAIETDLQGERRFYYWRQTAAARRLFSCAGIDEALEHAGSAGLLYVSGISFAIFDDLSRVQIIDLARRVRDNGGEVAFDPNYRVAHWPDPEQARALINSFAPLVTIALPTFADEQLLFGDEDASSTCRRWRDHGVREVVVKLGSAGCLVLAEDQGVIAECGKSVLAVDTTGAGDSFNAGYISARMRGASRRQAAAFGNRLAAEVILHRGAIVPAAFLEKLITEHGRLPRPTNFNSSATARAAQSAGVVAS